MVNKMVVDSSMKVRSNCFVKMVGENYYDSDEKIIPQIHLIFNSERDYDKMKEIERMVKKYFKLEKKYLNSEKKLILFYLKEMKSYMEDCEVMEVFSDCEHAFQEEFCYISKFIRNDMILSLPQRELSIVESDEDFIEEKLKNDEKYYEEYYGENEKYYKYIEKIRNLLLGKILH